MENMIQATKTVLTNYVKFEGRSGRVEYWWYVLAMFIVFLILAFLSGIVGIFGWISNILSLLLLVPNIALGIRRFHDIGKSGWWLLIGLIPILGWIAIIYFAAQPSVGPNEHGEGPQPLVTA